MKKVKVPDGEYVEDLVEMFFADLDLHEERGYDATNFLCHMYLLQGAVAGKRGHGGGRVRLYFWESRSKWGHGGGGSQVGESSRTFCFSGFFVFIGSGSWAFRLSYVNPGAGTGPSHIPSGERRIDSRKEKKRGVTQWVPPTTVQEL